MTGTVSLSVRRQVYARDGGKCTYCHHVLAPIETKVPPVPQRLLELTFAYRLAYTARNGHGDESRVSVLSDDIALFVARCEQVSEHVRATVESSPEYQQWTREMGVLETIWIEAGGDVSRRSQHRKAWERQQEIVASASQCVAALRYRVGREQDLAFPRSWLVEGRSLARERRALLDQQPEIDHIVARARGGSDALENLVLACATCNSQKRALSTQEWQDWQAQRQRAGGDGYRRTTNRPWEIMLPVAEMRG